jgi:hypothetical protein
VAQLKSAGKQFVVRYITVPGPQNKGISQAEFDELHEAGIETLVVYEGAAGDMKKGHAQGVADAKTAQANLKAIVGLDDHLPVYFGCDWDATPADQTAINAYLDGAASVIGRDRVGIYGGYYPVKRAKDAKKATWFWQTYAWSGGQVLPGIHLYQYKNNVSLGSGTVDYCRALQGNYGQKGVAPAPAPAVAVAPKPTPKPVVQTPAPVVEDPAIDIAKAADENTALDKANFHGYYWFKGTDHGDIFVYEPVSGTKRHVTSSEWAIIKLFGHDEVAVLPQIDADKIPTKS